MCPVCSLSNQCYSKLHIDHVDKFQMKTDNKWRVVLVIPSSQQDRVMLRQTLSGSGPRYCIRVQSLRTRRMLAFFVLLQDILDTLLLLLLWWTAKVQNTFMPFTQTFTTTNRIADKYHHLSKSILGPFSVYWILNWQHSVTFCGVEKK